MAGGKSAGGSSQADQAWLVCPQCGTAYSEPRRFCERCHYYTPSWAPSVTARARPRRWGRLLFLIALFLFLGFLAWLFYPSIPNPIILMRRPTSDLASLSRSGEWSVYGYDLAHTRYLPLVSPLPQGKVRWSRFLGEPTLSAPAVVDGVLYIGGHFKVHALEAGTGRPIWEEPATGPVHSSPVVAGPWLFVGLLDGRVLALERSSGELRWAFRTGNPVFNSGVVARGVLYIGSGDGAVYALDASTGRRLWKTQTRGAISSAAAVQDNILYAASSDGSLYSLTARTGQIRLRFRTLRSLIDYPVVANGLVYFVSATGRLYAVRHGAQEMPGEYQVKVIWAQLWLWRFPVPAPARQTGGVWVSSPKSPAKGFTSSPAVTPEALYLGDAEGRLYARDAITGTPLWEFKAEGRISAAPLVLGDVVYFGAEDGFLYALDRHRGQLLWRLSLGAPIKVGPVYAGGLLYVRTEEGELFALE